MEKDEDVSDDDIRHASEEQLCNSLRASRPSFPSMLATI